MINKLNNLLSDATDKLKEGKEDAAAKANEYLEKLGSLKDDAREKLLQYSQELITLIPLIEECGYRTAGFKIGIGIPPDIIFQFEKFKDISEEERNKILEAHKEKELLGIIVKAIVVADTFQGKLHPQNFRLNIIEVTIGIPPSVTIEMVAKD